MPMDKNRRAPLIGEHNQEVYSGELGLSADELKRRFKRKRSDLAINSNNAGAGLSLFPSLRAYLASHTESGMERRKQSHLLSSIFLAPCGRGIKGEGAINSPSSWPSPIEGEGME